MSNTGTAPRGIGRAATLLLVALLLSTPTLATEQPTIVFGGDLAYPPYESLDKGQPKGFTIELEDAIATAGNARAVHALGSWPAVVRALQSGEIDVVAMFVSPEREENFLFTSAIHYERHAIFVHEDSASLHALDELAGKTVAVEELSYAHRELLQQQKPVHLFLASNTLKALEAVAGGKADAAVLAVAPANELIQQHGLSLERVGMHFWPREYAFAVRKDRTELYHWLRTHLAEVVTNGEYEDIYSQWESRLKGNDDTLAASLRNAAIVVVPLILLGGLGMSWSWALQRTVNRRTRNLRTELKRRESAEAALQFAAHHDLHTRLSELHHFVTIVDDRLLLMATTEQSPAELAVLKLADLDSLSQTFGHDIASKLILRFAQRLQRIDCGPCGYLGRGVFLLFAERRGVRACLDLLSEEIHIGELELLPSIICGSASSPTDGNTGAVLVQRAETALAVSVSRNHEWTAYDATMAADKNDIRIVMDFRKSQGKELFPVFQPQVDLRTRRITGAEALVRWVHPELGSISPAKFIPLLERTGLVTHITRRMVDESVRMAASMRAKGAPMTISVNVAVSDFSDSRVVEIIREALRRHDCPASLLKLELTETSVSEDPESMRRVLEELSDLGIRISVDDFGTGWSSLSYLSQFPIHEIKIDREFVDGVAINPRKQGIVRSTVLMARELGMRTVAEGAEDNETIAFLQDCGCDSVQGYVIAKPMAAEHFMQFVEDFEGLQGKG